MTSGSEDFTWFCRDNPYDAILIIIYEFEAFKESKENASHIKQIKHQ